MARAKLTNDLVWSHSRAKLFRGCKRAYWFTYYGSWGGWDTQSHPRTRALYVEKKLTARPMWIGTVVHRVAEDGVKRACRGQAEDLAAARAWAGTATREEHWEQRVNLGADHPVAPRVVEVVVNPRQGRDDLEVVDRCRLAADLRLEDLVDAGRDFIVRRSAARHLCKGWRQEGACGWSGASRLWLATTGNYKTKHSDSAAAPGNEWRHIGFLLATTCPARPTS